MYFFAGSWFLIVAFTAFLNLSWTDWYYSDTIAEMSYAQLVWDQKTLFPEEWYFTTETFLNRPFPLTALLYGLTGDITASYPWGILLSGLLFSAVAYGYLAFLDLRKATIFFALGCFWVLYVNWVLLFSLLSYGYAGMFAAVLLTLWAYQSGSFRLRCLSLSVAFFLGLGSPRMLVILYLPLLLLDLIHRLRERGGLRLLSFSSGLLLCNLGGYAFLKYVLAEHYTISFSSGKVELDSLSRLPGNVLLTGKGVWEMLQLGEPIMLAVFLAALTGAVLALGGSSPRRREALLFFLLSELASFGVLVLAKGWYAARYHVPISFFVILALAFLLDRAWDFIHRSIVVAAGALLLLAGSYSTYGVHLPFLQEEWSAKGFGPGERAVAEYLMEEDIHRAYATYWRAGPLKMISGGSIEAGQFTEKTMEPHLWGTDRRLYHPGAYTERVAVLLTKEEEEQLEEAGREILKQGTFQKEINGMYHIYFFETNPILFRENGK